MKVREEREESMKREREEREKRKSERDGVERKGGEEIKNKLFLFYFKR